VKTPDDLSRVVERVRSTNDPRNLDRGRTAWYDERDNTLVIHDPNHEDQGTVFRPKTGADYVKKLS
jgi:hypothetical protein